MENLHHLHRILIATGIYPPDIGGPATMLGALAKSLEDNGFEIKILTYSDAPKNEEKIFRIDKGHYLKYFLKMLKLSRWADVVYATDTYSVGYFAYLLKKLTGKQYVLRFTGDSAWETAVGKGWTNDYIVDFQNKIYSNRIEKMKRKRKKILISADGIIVDSHFLAGIASKIGVSPQKIHIIYNAVDFFENVPQWAEPSSPAMIFSGRLIPWKGVQMLIELMPRLKEKYPDLVFKIIGDGPEEKNLKSQISNLKINGVVFGGRMSEEETQKIMARSTIFVLNSNYEGLPHSVLNALNVGLPVITTPAGGNPEVIQNEYNGLLAPYNDREVWFKAITRLLGDKNLCEKFSINGKKTLEKFKWSELVEKTIGVFKEV